MRPGSKLKLKEPRAVRVGREAHINVILAANRGLAELEPICRAHNLTHQQYIAL